MNEIAPAMDIDIRSLWALGRTAFLYSILVTGLLVKPVVVRRVTHQAWPASMLGGFALTISGSVLVAVVPISFIRSLVLTEVLLKGFAGRGRLGVIAWVCPAVVSVLVASACDMVIMFRVYGQKISRRLSSLTLFANAICFLAAAYVLFAYVDGHPPEA